MELPIDMAVRQGISNEVLCKIKEQNNYVITDLSTMGVASDGTGILSWSHVAPMTHTITTELECQSDATFEQDVNVKQDLKVDGLILTNTLQSSITGRIVSIDQIIEVCERPPNTDLDMLITTPHDTDNYNQYRCFAGGVVTMWDYIYHLPSLFEGLGIDQWRMDQIKSNLCCGNEPNVFDHYGIDESPQQKMQEMRDEIEDLKMQIQDLRITLSNLVP